MQINPIIIKILALIEKAIFYILRSCSLIFCVPILISMIIEKIHNNYSHFQSWQPYYDGWHGSSVEYYMAAINFNITTLSIVVLAAILAPKLPRYVLYIVVLLYVTILGLLAYFYSKDNPPTWILDIF